MLFLGINEGFNASVVVCQDGQITFALQEERLNKSKEYCGFPRLALAFTLTYLSLRPQDIQAICLSNLKSPRFTREQYLRSYDMRAEKPYRGRQIYRIRGRWLRRKDSPLPSVAEELHALGLADVPVIRQHHHVLHAASAYYGMRANATEPHLVLTLDGGGDGDCARVYKVEDQQFELLARTPQGHSVGNLYSAMTHFMGLKPHEHEYKLMGLAAYANSAYYEPVVATLSRYLDLDPANPLVFLRTIPEPTSSIGYRLAQDFKRERFDNLAGGMQRFTEELLLRWVTAAVKATGIRNVVVAGGVFMNVKANKRIAAEVGLDFFDVMPSCGDESLAFGAVWHAFAQTRPSEVHHIRLKTLCLGPTADFDLKSVATQHDNLRFEVLPNPHQTAADLMAQGHVVARCAGPMEFGARALGNRTIMADASRPDIVSTINKIIKKRDFWMPFAPAMLQTHASEYVAFPDSLQGRGSPFMMHTFDTTKKRADFVAGVHAYDHTSRAQTVTREQAPDFWEILDLFRAQTGKAVCLNTSFNLHGLPIVLGAEDAIHVLVNSGLEYLILENVLVTKA